MASTTTAALVHARCACSPRLASPNFRGFLSSPSSSSPSSSSPPSSSSSTSSGESSSVSRNPVPEMHACDSFEVVSSEFATTAFYRTEEGVNSLRKQQDIKAQSMSTSSRVSLESPRGTGSVKNEADHLLVLVHGILASTSDWIYVEAELKRRLGINFVIYASSCNTFTKTLNGIDAAGRRLADEVTEVVQKTDGLKKISFLAHSLGGLFARYAVAVLYTPKSSTSVQPDNTSTSTSRALEKPSIEPGLIAGLEPVNFITLATPHLGVRGRKQLPFLLGVSLLEKLAVPMAPYLVGKTGSQLFLTDGSPNKPPLLLRMASDCKERKFISALGAFKCRILYANVSYDHMVGWRTSSIRREMELVKPPQRSLDGYKHVVDVEYCLPILTDGAHFSPEAAKAKAAAQNAPTIQNTVEYHEIVEEEMIQGLQQLGWKKVDVSFHSAMWPFFAHNNIHVKNEWLHYAGAGVVAHVADNLKQQESSSSYMAASL